jgi:hypothetical protein
MPGGSEFPARAELWTLLRESRRGADRGFQFIRVIGRLKPGDVAKVMAQLMPAQLSSVSAAGEVGPAEVKITPLACLCPVE